jgi:hypothetical protein
VTFSRPSANKKHGNSFATLPSFQHFDDISDFPNPLGYTGMMSGCGSALRRRDPAHVLQFHSQGNRIEPSKFGSKPQFLKRRQHATQYYSDIDGFRPFMRRLHAHAPSGETVNHADAFVALAGDL